MPGVEKPSVKGQRTLTFLCCSQKTSHTDAWNILEFSTQDLLWEGTRRSTWERNLTRVRNVGRASAGAPTCPSTGECTQARSPIDAVCAGRTSAVAPTSPSTSASTQVRNPSAATSVARTSAAGQPCRSTRASTQGGSPMPVRCVTGASPRALRWLDTSRAMRETRPICATRAAGASAREPTSTCTSVFTRERGRSGARPVGSASAGARTWVSTGGSTRASGPTDVRLAAGTSGITPPSRGTRGCTQGRSPTPALHVGRASVRESTCRCTRRCTDGRGFRHGLCAGRWLPWAGPVPGHRCRGAQRGSGLMMAFVSVYTENKGLPRWLSGNESACQCGRYWRLRFVPWVGKIPWSRQGQPTPVFLPGQSRGQRSLVGYDSLESDTTEWLSMLAYIREDSSAALRWWRNIERTLPALPEDLCAPFHSLAHKGNHYSDF